MEELVAWESKGYGSKKVKSKKATGALYVRPFKEDWNREVKDPCKDQDVCVCNGHRAVGCDCLRRT